ncbi:MAG: hypothetical protein JNM17_05535 [Archangium sp.]|nr:hypothetical protein [Archangium sp.]
MSTAISHDVRIRAEGKVEVIERAVARFENAVRSLQADDPQQALPVLSTEERDAIAEIERLDPGAELLATLRNAQRGVATAAQAWAHRHGLKNAEGHLPLRVKERHWSRAEHGIRLFGAGTMLVVGIAATAASHALGGLVGVSAFYFAVTLLAAMALIVFPRKRQVVITPSALIIGGVAISFEKIIFIEERARFADTSELNIVHERTTTKLTVRPEVTDELQRTIREWRKQHDGASPP